MVFTGRIADKTTSAIQETTAKAANETTAGDKDPDEPAKNKLHGHAQELNIEGRNSMNREQLIEPTRKSQS